MQSDKSFTEAVAQLARRIRVVYPGQELTFEDQRFVQDVLVMQSCMIMDLGLATEDAKRSWFTFLSGGSLDLLRYDRTFKWIAEFLIANLNRSAENLGDTLDGHFSFSRRSVKRYVTDHSLYWGCVAPIYDCLVSYLKHPTVETFRVLRQWACLPSRMNLRSIDLRVQCEEEYAAFEEEIKHWSYASGTLLELNQIVKVWLRDFRVDYTNSHHGPGSIAEGEGRPPAAIKNCLINFDARLRYLSLRRDNFPTPTRSTELRRNSILVCVPKSISKNRTISKEPCALQFCQQAFFSSLMDFLNTHEGLGSHVDLSDQAQSRSMAQYGSLRGDYATIDLSSASDSVTLTLVKALFRGCHCYADLICTRSDSTTLPSGKELVLEKFAPMGSACCFPVECIVFSSICELAVRRTVGRTSRSDDYRVYGDDIVIQERYAAECLRILSECHFTVNLSKSYYGESLLNFREACGIEAVAGVDVTPLRLSRWIRYDDHAEISSVNVVSSWCALYNALSERGFKFARQWVYQILKRFRYERYLPFYSGRYGICVEPHLTCPDDCCTNFRLVSRWDCKVFKRAYKGVVAVSRPNRADKAKFQSMYALTDNDIEEGRYALYWQLRRRYPVYRQEHGVTFAPEPTTADSVRLEWRTTWLYAV